MKTCTGCQIELDLSQFHLKSRMWKGKKYSYMTSKCRTCEYNPEVRHRTYIKHKDKNFDKMAEYTRRRRKLLQKRKRCVFCAIKLKHSARLCISCYVSWWITGVIGGFRRSKVYPTLDVQLVEERINWIRDNESALLSMCPRRGYPDHRLKHIKSVAKHPELLFDVRNIAWRHENRNGG